jgi:hypothetical protein
MSCSAGYTPTGNSGPKQDVMCMGIDEIREIVRFWKQVVTDADGGQQEAYGIGGSWFRYAGNGKFSWQRDFFDFGHSAALYGQLIKAGTLSEGMRERIERQMAGEAVPGRYSLGKAPVPLW